MTPACLVSDFNLAIFVGTPCNSGNLDFISIIVFLVFIVDYFSMMTPL